MIEPINLRSDTQTLPTAEMRRAMAEAELGDDMWGEDPTVNQLEELVAGRFEREAAVLVASGTMGNLASLMAQARPGDEVLLGAESHVYYYEGGSIASVAGLMPRLFDDRRGYPLPEEVEAALRPSDQHFPRSRVLCLENTHNRAGGRIVPLEILSQLSEVARKHELRIHLDGARIFNAAVASGVPVARYAALVDSLTFCLSKGLSAPIGSLIVGDGDLIAEVRRCRKRLGGAMRQAGVIAAAGIVALETMVDRLAEDHANARRLAEALMGLPRLRIDLDSVETNMIYVECAGTGCDGEAFAAHLRQAGVLVSAVPPSRIRLVTNRHVSAAATEEAASRIARVCHELP